MKVHTIFHSLQSLGAAIAVLGLVAVIPSVQADDDAPKIKIKDDKIKIKGKDALEMLKPEVAATFVDGYTVPSEYQTHFTEIPAGEAKDVFVRYRGGRAYHVDSTGKILRIVDLDPTIERTEADAAFVEGYMIPETHRTQFVEVPNPDAGMTVRYYNNTAYYMDPQYRIVRTVRLVK